MNKQIQAAAKRMAAIIAAGAMAVAPGVATLNVGTMTAWADIANEPTSVPTDTVSIKGLNAGDIVSLYQIVQPTYDSNNAWSGWEKVSAAGDNVSIDSDGTDLSVNVGGLVTSIKATNSTWGVADSKTVAENSTEFTSSALKPGIYLGLIAPGTTSNGDLRIYNPVILSVSYGNGENGLTADGGEIADIKTATFGDGITNTTTGIKDTAYAKSSVTSLHKYIVNKDSDGVTATDPGKVKAEDLQKGDTSDFQIESKIPDYSGFTNLGDDLTFRIDDNQDAQFGKPQNVTVKVGTTNVTSQVTITYGSFNTDGNSYEGSLSKQSPTDDNDEDFSVSFPTSVILSHPGEDVTITYSAVLVSPVIYNATDNNDNNVKLTYSNNNQNKDSYNTKNDKTTDYSFKIDVKKVDATTTTKTLAGAKFKLTRMYLDNTLKEYTPNDGDHSTSINEESSKTGSDGIVHFTGLDEGYYRIVETQAPTDGTTQYTKNGESFYIHVVPTYPNQNTSTEITGYTITQVDENGNPKTDTALNRAENNTTSDYTLTVKDTPVHGLPSTGARSALILTIAGIGVMVVVLAASRRKKVED